MGFTCDVKLDIVLSSKQEAAGSELFQIVVKIRMMHLDDGTYRWGYLGDHDYRMPTGGPFEHQNGEVILKDPDGNPFAKLTAFPDPPTQSAAGAIYVYNPGARSYAPTPIQWRGTGKWAMLALSIGATPVEAALDALHKTWHFTEMTDYFVITTGGFSVSYGGDKGYGAEYTDGVIEIGNTRWNQDPSKGPVQKIRLRYHALGGGWMTPGVGGTLAPTCFKNFGSYVVRGTLPSVGMNFTPKDFVGPCAIIEGSASITGVMNWIPKLEHVPEWVKTGAGASLATFLFGTLGGPGICGINLGSAAFPAYRCGAVVLGPSVAVALGNTPKKWSAGAGLTVNLGTMEIDHEVSLRSDLGL